MALSVSDGTEIAVSEMLAANISEFGAGANASERRSKMHSEPEVQEYLAEIRELVCSRCVERPPGGPPCAPLGKRCGVELHLPLFIHAVQEIQSPLIEPYLENIHRRVCSQCVRRGGDGCPCPLDYLLVLLVQAIESVDQRRHARNCFRTKAPVS